MPIFAHRTMDVFHLLGLGCPRSEELSGSGRLFFIHKKNRPFFGVYNKILRITNTFSKKRHLETAKKHRQMTVMTDDSLLKLRA